MSDNAMRPLRLPNDDGFYVDEGFTYVGRLLGEQWVERDDNGHVAEVRYENNVGLFSCDTCGSAVTDQRLHTRWHEAHSAAVQA